jgi:hypothetical protein
MRSKAMKTRNHVHKNMFKFNKPKVVPDKKKQERKIACRKALVLV